MSESTSFETFEMLQGSGIAAALCAHIQQTLTGPTAHCEGIEQLTPAPLESSSSSSIKNSTTNPQHAALLPIPTASLDPSASCKNRTWPYCGNGCAAENDSHAWQRASKSGHPDQQQDRLGMNAVPSGTISRIACLKKLSLDAQLEVRNSQLARWDNDKNCSGVHSGSMPEHQCKHDFLYLEPLGQDQACQAAQCPLKQFSFAMLFSGYMPQAPQLLKLRQQVAAINLPSLHCFGSAPHDWQVSPDSSRDLATWFSGHGCPHVVKQHDNGHMVPASHADVQGYFAFMDDAMEFSVS